MEILNKYGPKHPGMGGQRSGGIGGVFLDSDASDDEAENLRRGLEARGHTIAVQTAGQGFLLSPDGNAFSREDVSAVATGYQYDGPRDNPAEPVVDAYEDHGTRFAEHLDGVLNAAVYDAERDRLHLVRDRLGHMPLYYARREGGVLFSGYLTAMLACSAIDAELDRQSVFDVLATTGASQISRNATLVNGVNAMRPSELLRWDRGSGIDASLYWHVPRGEPRTVSDETAVKRTHALMREAAETLAQQHEGPPKVLFSGGMDSRILAALLGKISEEPVETYTMVRSEDRSERARTIADAIGATHTEVRYPERAITPEEVWRADEPAGGLHVFRPTLLAEHGLDHVYSGMSAGALFPPPMPKLRLCDRVKTVRPLHWLLKRLYVERVARLPGIADWMEIGADILAGPYRSFSLTYERFRPARSEVTAIMPGDDTYDSYAVEKTIDANWDDPRPSFRDHHTYLTMREIDPLNSDIFYPQIVRHNVFGYPPLVSFQMRLPFAQRKGRRILRRVGRQVLPPEIPAQTPTEHSEGSFSRFYFTHAWEAYRERIERFLERGLVDADRARPRLIPDGAPGTIEDVPFRWRSVMRDVETLELWIERFIDQDDGWKPM